MFRWYQDAAIDSIYEYFDANVGNPIVAMPGGTGKSHVIGGFMQRVLQQWPRQRFMCLTHVKELIVQNATKLYEMWPNAPIGIYSAGLGHRDTVMPIIFGGVASVRNCIQAFGHRDLLLIDEGHLVSDEADGMYQYVIAELKKINPYLKIILFTATPFRMGQGLLTEGSIATDFCFNMCGVDGFNQLLAEGWISPLIPHRTNVEIDVSNVGMHHGEYSQAALQAAADKNEITYAAVNETVSLGQERRSWLAFASGVEHAEHVAAMLRSFGISSAAIHSKMSKTERDARIKGFRSGEMRCAVNNNVLTTGFDHPPIDLIMMARPTLSTSLWVQMLSRGTRPSAETFKQNCLCLDFAGNRRRLGPINDPAIPRKKGKSTGEVPVKICEHCGTYNHARVRFCISCGAKFTFDIKLFKTSGTDELLRSDIPIVEYFNVDRVIYNRHAKNGSPVSIKVSYFCGLRMFNEWIGLEHVGFAGKRARDWWRQRHWEEPPATTDQALLKLSELRVPRRIRVWVNKKWPEVTGYEY